MTSVAFYSRSLNHHPRNGAAPRLLSICTTLRSLNWNQYF
jgi:hypothetical protein